MGVVYQNEDRPDRDLSLNINQRNKKRVLCEIYVKEVSKESKRKILSSFIHPRVILNLNDFLL